jgi:hypothetical protein
MHAELPPDNTHPLTDAQVGQYHCEGYLILPGLLDAEETDLLITTAKADKALHDHAYGAKDSKGRKSRLSLWNHPGDDLFGIVSRSRRIVDAMEQLLGGEVYHYHSKLMLKEPVIGGAWEWHQDYGYWYQNDCLFPYHGKLPDRAGRPDTMIKQVGAKTSSLDKAFLDPKRDKTVGVSNDA